MMKNSYAWKSQIEWVDEEILNECPSVVAHEYARVKKLLNTQDYGAMMELKDTAESIVKLYTIIGLCLILQKERKTEDDCRLITEITTIKLSFGHWATAARELIDKQLIDDSTLIEVIEGFYDLVDNGNNNIVNWRNRCIGHGALGYAGTEQFKNDFVPILNSLSSFLEDNINSISAITLQTEEGMILKGINAADSVATKSKAVYVLLGGKRISLFPFLTISEGKIFFFDWFLELNTQSNRLNYYWNESIKSRLEDEVTAQIAEIHRLYKSSSKHFVLEKGNSAFLKADSSYLFEMEELLRNQISVESSIKAEFFEKWIREKLEEKKNQSFLLIAPEAYGKTTCIKQFIKRKNPIRIRNTTVRVVHLNDSYNSRTEFILQDIEIALTHDVDGKVLIKSSSELAINRKTDNPAEEFAHYLSRIKRILSDQGICKDRLLLVIDGIDEIVEGARSFLQYIDCESYLADDIFLLFTSRYRDNGIKFGSEAVYDAEEDFKLLMSEYVRINLPNCSQEYRKSIIDMENVNFAFIHLLTTVFDNNYFLEGESADQREIMIVIQYMRKLEAIYGSKYLKDFLSILYLLAYSDVPLAIADIRMLSNNSISEFAIVGILHDMIGILTCSHGTVNKYSILHKFLKAGFFSYFEIALKNTFDFSTVHEGILATIDRASEDVNNPEDIHLLWVVFCSHYILKDSSLQKKLYPQLFASLYEKIAFSYLGGHLDDLEQVKLKQVSHAMSVTIDNLGQYEEEPDKKLTYEYLSVFFSSKRDWNSWYINKVNNNEVDDLLNDKSELSICLDNINMIKESLEEDLGVKNEFSVTEESPQLGLYLMAVDARKSMLDSICSIYENLKGGESVWIKYLEIYREMQKVASETKGLDTGLLYSELKLAEAYLRVGNEQKVEEHLLHARIIVNRQELYCENYYLCKTLYLITEVKSLISRDLEKCKDSLMEVYDYSHKLCACIQGREDLNLPLYAEYFQSIAEVTYQIERKFLDEQKVYSQIIVLQAFVNYAENIQSNIQRICRQEIVELVSEYAYRLMLVNEVNVAMRVISKYLRDDIWDISCSIVPKAEYQFYYGVSNCIYNIKKKQPCLNEKYIEKLGEKGLNIINRILQLQESDKVSLNIFRVLEMSERIIVEKPKEKYLDINTEGKVVCRKKIFPKIKKHRRLGKVYIFNAKYCNVCEFENCPARKHPHMFKAEEISDEKSNMN